jgi:hypothetical protein
LSFSSVVSLPLTGATARGAVQAQSNTLRAVTAIGCIDTTGDPHES